MTPEVRRITYGVSRVGETRGGSRVTARGENEIDCDSGGAGWDYGESIMMKSMSLACCATALAVVLYAGNWPQWRGPSLNGISPEKNLPLRWSTTENVAWWLAMPDRSGSTPIIWGDHIFLHVAEGQSLYLWCVDKAKGTPRWKKLIGTGNYKSSKQNMSSPSPVTDGKSVFVMTGTGVLKSFDFNGAELWMRDIQKDYGKFGVKWGYASSPLLHESGLYVQVLHGTKTRDPSYLLPIDKQTGGTVWRVERPTEAIRESHDSYRTPSLLKHGGRTEIVIADGDAVTGHDPATGKELWRARGLNPSPTSGVSSSTVVFGDIVIVPTHIRPMLAFRAGGRGDISASHRLWSFDDGPDVSTPVTDGKYFYMVNH